MNSGSLVFAILLASAVTILLKTAPVTILKGDSLPKTLRAWLNYVPAAVMAALVAPDIFVYNGKLDFSLDNLFLLVSIPTFLIAWVTRNYFVTIAAGIGMVILARFYGFS